MYNSNCLHRKQCEDKFLPFLSSELDLQAVPMERSGRLFHDLIISVL